MASSRRSQFGGARGGPLLLALALCAFLCASGMGFVWHRNRNDDLARQIRQVAARIDQLRAVNQILDRQLEELRSPQALEAGVRKWNLGLVMPPPESILRLPPPPNGAVTRPIPNYHFAARTSP